MANTESGISQTVSRGAKIEAQIGQAVRPAATTVAVQQLGTEGQKPKQADGQSALLTLLKVEAEVRDAANARDLIFIMANETRKLTRARQIFVMMPGFHNSLEVQGVSSLPSVDRHAPLVVLVEGLVRAAAERGGLKNVQPLVFPVSGEDGTADAYPFRSLLWAPLQHGTKPAIGGLLLAREDAWSDQDTVIAKRLVAAYAHAWLALQGPTRNYTAKIFNLSRWHGAAFLAVVAALLFVKVPLSVLAPAEIVARDPFVVAAPIDGVIDTVAVDASQTVKLGDLLIKLADTTLRNRLQVAEREVQVAEARLKQFSQIAFSDPRGMHEIGISRAELELKLAEQEFARDLLAKTEIRAQRGGIALYSDKHDLVGRPVAVGERMLEVADASQLEARIDLPVADAIALAPGTRVKLFLDSEPLSPWMASVRRADYKAKAGENDVVSFRVTADLALDSARALPRLGVHGTAQVSGNDVPLGLYLFRRPITAFRQWLGR